MEELTMAVNKNTSIEEFVEFITHNLTYKQVLELYLRLKEVHNTPSIKAITEYYKIIDEDGICL